MPTPQSLGSRIAQARRELGVRLQRDIAQRDVANAIGMSPAAVSQWEADGRTPSEEVLGKLAAYLGVTPAFLRYGITEPVLQPASPAPAPAPIPEHKRVRTIQGVGRIVAGRGAPEPQPEAITETPKKDRKNA